MTRQTKLAKAESIIDSLVDTLICPVCSAKLALNQENHTLICTQGHVFNINKKGFLYLLAGAKKTFYDRQLFESRRKVFELGYYETVVDAICKMIAARVPIAQSKAQRTSLKLLDAGCGEGYYIDAIMKKIHAQMSSDGADAMPYHINAIGLDIEKSAVAMATDYPEDVLYMVADLARIPVADKSIHLILNILTPANYKEFSRILMDDGLVLKVIPGTDYLKEIRAILEEESEPDAPDNATLNYNEGKIDIAYRQRIHDTCEVPDAHRHLFFEMSPLTKGKTISDYDIKKLKAITIDYELILGRPNIKLI